MRIESQNSTLERLNKLKKNTMVNIEKMKTNGEISDEDTCKLQSMFQSVITSVQQKTRDQVVINGNKSDETILMADQLKAQKAGSTPPSGTAMKIIAGTIMTTCTAAGTMAGGHFGGIVGGAIGFAGGLFGGLAALTVTSGVLGTPSKHHAVGWNGEIIRREPEPWYKTPFGKCAIGGGLGFGLIGLAAPAVSPLETAFFVTTLALGGGFLSGFASVLGFGRGWGQKE